MKPPPTTHEPCWICLGSGCNQFNHAERCPYCNGRGYTVKEVPCPTSSMA